MTGLAAGGVLLALAAVMTSQVQFSQSYMEDQLAQQKITFKVASALSEEERRSSCLVENAGKRVTTGKQAECYANHFIGLHLRSIAKGRTYAEVSGAHNALRAQMTVARANNDPELPRMQEEFTELSRQRQSLFEGEAMRGVLLSSYGFSVLADKATQAATITNYAGVLLLLVSSGVIVHSLMRRN